MKRKEKTLAMDEAVETLAAIMDPVLSKFSPQEKAERLQECQQFISSVKKKEPFKPSKFSRVPLN
jgi:hypothetical protein